MKQNAASLLSDDSDNGAVVALDAEFDLDDDDLETLQLGGNEGGVSGQKDAPALIGSKYLLGKTDLAGEANDGGKQKAQRPDTHEVDLEIHEDHWPNRAARTKRGRWQEEALEERSVALAQGALEVVAESAAEALQSLLKEKRASLKEIMRKNGMEVGNEELSSASQRRRDGSAMRMTAAGARVGGELVALFAGNMIDAVISAAELEGEATAEKEHLEQALPQLLLDF